MQQPIKKLNSAKKEIKIIDDFEEMKSSNEDEKLDIKGTQTTLSYTVKPKEAIQYLSRTIEKFQMKVIEKEKRLEEKQQIMLNKKTR